MLILRFVLSHLKFHFVLISNYNIYLRKKHPLFYETKITTLPLHHKIFICHNKKRYVTQIKLSSHILNIFMIISSFTHEPFHSSEYPPAVPASGSCSLKSEKTTPALKLFQNLYMLHIFH